MGNPLQPSATVLTKLGSIVVHVEEYIVTGHPFDMATAKQGLSDDEVRQWLDDMGKLALIPLKRG